MKESLHFIGVPPQNTHTVFVDSEKELRKFKEEKFFDVP